MEPIGFIEKGTFAPHLGKIFADRHMNEHGWCCLNLPAESSWDTNDKDGLRKWLTNLVFFIHKQFIYDATGNWPGPQCEHGSGGWAQYVEKTLDPIFIPAFIGLARGTAYGRNDPCPCDSGSQFAQCHKRMLDDLFATLPNDFQVHRRIANLLEGNNKNEYDLQFALKKPHKVAPEPLYDSTE